MESMTHNDIRKLLKNFGILADEAILAHIDRLPEGGPLHLRLTLEDLTDYPGDQPAERLHLELEGEVRRR